MAITSAISDLFKSFYELLASILGTAYSLVHGVFSAIFSFIAGILNLSGDVVQGMVDVVGGVGKFVTGNIVILAIGAVGAFAYFRYTAQGQKQVSAKKTS